MALGIQQLDEITVTQPLRHHDLFKRCPRCPEMGREPMRPRSDFGICRARKDGLNLYCKVCIREKINAHRIALRRYKTVLRARLAKSAAPTTPPKKSVVAVRHDLRLQREMRRAMPTERIVFSLKTFGPQDYDTLAKTTKLSKDELGEALSEVLGRGLPVGSRNGSGPRVYFLNSENQSRKLPPAHREPRSFGVSSIYSEGA